MKKQLYKGIFFLLMIGAIVSVPVFAHADEYDYFAPDFSGSGDNYDYFAPDYSGNDYDYFAPDNNEYDYFAPDNGNEYDYFAPNGDGYDYFAPNSDEYDYFAPDEQYDYYAPDEYDYYAPDEYDYYAPNNNYSYNGGSSYYSNGSSSFHASIGTYGSSYYNGGGYYGGGGYYYNGGGYGYDGCGSNCGGGGGGGGGNRDLVIHCAANNDEIEVGESVTWIAQATGGNGNYTYTWTGSDGLLGQQRTVTKSYEEKGIKSATLTVKSGNKQKTVACTDVFVSEERVVDPRPNLSVSCSASDTNVETDEHVTWTARATGGNGNYTYDWDGSEDLSGTGRSVSISYDNEGDKIASVRVTSGNQSEDVRCDDEVNVEDDNDDEDDEDDRDVRVSCSADVTSTSNGTRVRWTANVSRENGSVDYDWSGTDGLSGDDDSITKTYYTSGMKYAQVEVEDSDDDTDDAECSVFVNAVLGYTTTYVPPYIPPTTQGTGIYLSQVPYTGIEDISLSLALFLGPLTLASGVAAYKIVKVKAKRDGAREEVSEAELEIIARGAGLIFSRDALQYVAAIARREKRDAKEVITYIRGKVAKVEDGMRTVSLQKAKQIVA